MNNINTNNINVSKLKLIGIIILAIIVVILVFVFGFQGVQNGAISIAEQVETAISNINVQEKRRADLIPNLVDCVKEYDRHEYETLMAVIEARGNNLNNEDVNEITNSINFVAEQYPELKSSENYKQLMTELAVTENLIAEYRNSYNSFVQSYNVYCKKFPNSFILGVLGYEKLEYQRLEFDVNSDAPNNLFG